jgi:hypothetical protein
MMASAVSMSYCAAAYARVQEPVNTAGGTGESIVRCVQAMPIIALVGRR